MGLRHPRFYICCNSVRQLALLISRGTTFHIFVVRYLNEPFSGPFRIDRNRSGGGVLIYVSDDISSKLLTKHFFPNDIKVLVVELNFRKYKWHLLGTYYPPPQ